MGVKGLTGYVKRDSRYYYKQTTLENTKLLVDGSILFTNMYYQTDESGGRYGAEYQKFVEVLKEFLRKWKPLNVEPIIVLDGLRWRPKELAIHNFENYILRSIENDQPTTPALLTNVYIEVMRELGVKCIMASGGAHNTMALVAKIWDCPVLSKDGNFFLYDVKFFNEHEFINNSPCLKMFDCSALKNRFNINSSLFPLLLVLLGHINHYDLLNPEVMKPFMDRLAAVFGRNDDYSFRPEIPQTLKWAGHYTSLNEAVSDLLACIDKLHRQGVINAINRGIYLHCKPSRAALKALGFRDTTISNLITMHNNRFPKFERDLDKLKVSKILSSQMDKQDDNEESEKRQLSREYPNTDKYFELSENEVYDTIPHKVIDELTTMGKIRGLCIEIRVYKAVLLHPQCEYTRWEGYGEICLPIVSAIFSIVSPSTAKTDDLEVYTNRGSELVVRKITVPKSNNSLADIGRLGVDECRAILNKALGLHPDEKIAGIPNQWKLYIACIVFWMKSETPRKKEITYLRAVIAAILRGVIMKVTSKKIPSNKSLVEDMKSCSLADKSSLQQMVDAINDKECAVARALFNHKFDERTNDFERKAAIINSFGQIDVCLKFLMDFNGLLAFPYDDIIIHELIDGPFFYNFFNIAEKYEKNFSEFLSKKLQGAPNVLKSFLALEKIVMNLVEG
uniref:Asteroid domain-containing protein n=1 Tax=Bracon brevicornis TaxID=1563983 RepID=A0A6V7KK16_9HYME